MSPHTLFQAESIFAKINIKMLLDIWYKIYDDPFKNIEIIKVYFRCFKFNKNINIIKPIILPLNDIDINKP